MQPEPFAYAAGLLAVQLDPVAIAEGGPVVMLLVGIGLLAWGFIKGWVVPGWLYRQERDARIAAETQAERNTDAVVELASASRELNATVRKTLDVVRRRPSGG